MRAERFVGRGDFDAFGARESLGNFGFQKEGDLPIERQLVLAAEGDCRWRITELDILADEGDLRARGFHLGRKFQHAAVFESDFRDQRLDPA